jgi:OOP family OmpA-OmpF porin
MKNIGCGMKNLSTYFFVPLIIASFAFVYKLNAVTYPYIGFSIGRAKIEDACESSGISVISCEDSDTSFKVYGGAKTHRNFAFEVAYIDLGESVITDNVDALTIEAAGINSSVFGIIPASNNLDIFAKVGLMYWEAKKSSSGTFNGTIASSEGLDITFGFGANFGVSRTFALRAEFEKFPRVGGEQTTGESGVTLITLGAAFYF